VGASLIWPISDVSGYFFEKLQPQSPGKATGGAGACRGMAAPIRHADTPARCENCRCHLSYTRRLPAGSAYGLLEL
jgi:hypothetical protein